MKMPQFARLASAVALLLLNVGIIPSVTAAQTGGVPSLAEQITVLQGQVQTLQTQVQGQLTAITTLQTTIVNLQTSNSGLQTMLNALQAALDAEKAARIAGDNSLQTALGTEIGKRISEDLALDALIQLANNTESSDVTGLQNQIDALNNSAVGDVFVGHGGESPFFNNNNETVVASVSVPAGTYLIHAVVPVRNEDSDEQSGECGLNTVPVAFFGSAGDARLFFMPPGTDAQLPLIDVRTFATDTTVTVSCTGFQWDAHQPTIVAVRIRSIE